MNDAQRKIVEDHAEYLESMAESLRLHDEPEMADDHLRSAQAFRAALLAQSTPPPRASFVEADWRFAHAVRDVLRDWEGKRKTAAEAMRTIAFCRDAATLGDPPKGAAGEP